MFVGISNGNKSSKRQQILFVEISNAPIATSPSNPCIYIQSTEREGESASPTLSMKREKEKEGGFVAAIAGILLSQF